MGCQEHVHKLGYRTNLNIQKSKLNLERLTGHPNQQVKRSIAIINFLTPQWMDIVISILH